MSTTANPACVDRRAASLRLALICIFACYTCARILEVSPPSIPHTAIVALDVFSALAFALVDGTRHYGLRVILVFAAICTVIGNIVENIGVATGFPFGRYYFVELMGPKILHVPILLGLAYIGMAYVAWNIACLILPRSNAFLTGPRFFALPALASVIMTAWDLAQDPVWATVLHGWIWRDGGAWFGVPLSNYCGWLATVFFIYVLFALYLRFRAPRFVAPPGIPASRRAVLFYALCAICNILQILPRPDPALVADPTGKLWRVADITHASALVSVFVMGSFVALALFRAPRPDGPLTA
ncbi:MAG: carotenoid biosynthesis protein [Terracidiphilus sp.]